MVNSLYLRLLPLHVVDHCLVKYMHVFSININKLNLDGVAVSGVTQVQQIIRSCAASSLCPVPQVQSAPTSAELYPLGTGWLQSYS